MAEEQIKSDLTVAIRALPGGPEFEKPGRCAFSGEESKRKAVFARSC